MRLWLSQSPAPLKFTASRHLPKQVHDIPVFARALSEPFKMQRRDSWIMSLERGRNHLLFGGCKELDV